MRRIYLDHHATTPVDPAVMEAMRPWFTERFGHPDRPHAVGWEARVINHATHNVNAAYHF